MFFTFPVQVVVGAVLLGRALGRLFDFASPFAFLTDSGLFEATIFVMSLVPVIADPALGGMLLRWPKAERPLKI